jgi:hypothetical protein
MLGRPEPCRPLTRRPGSWAPIPGCRWQVQLFPTQLRLLGPAQERQIIDLNITGPVQQWTAQLDLDHQEIRIWGRAQDFFLFRLGVVNGALVLRGKRADDLNRVLVEQLTSPAACVERLQFGCHAMQDVERLNAHVLPQIVPTWFRLGMALEHQAQDPAELSLMGRWAQALQNQDRRQAAELILQLRRAGFQDLWAPQQVDHQFWGFGLPPTLSDPFHLLAAGARLLRKMILTSDEDSCTLLPLLPKELPAGRFLNAQWPGVGALHLEFTRGRPRRLVLEPHVSRSVRLVWDGDHARVRVLKEGVPIREGERQLKSGDPLEIVAGRSLHLDRFWQS